MVTLYLISAQTAFCMDTRKILKISRQCCIKLGRLSFYTTLTIFLSSCSKLWLKTCFRWLRVDFRTSQVSGTVSVRSILWSFLTARNSLIDRKSLKSSKLCSMRSRLSFTKACQVFSAIWRRWGNSTMWWAQSSLLWLTENIWGWIWF